MNQNRKMVTLSMVAFLLATSPISMAESASNQVISDSSTKTKQTLKSADNSIDTQFALVAEQLSDDYLNLSPMTASYFDRDFGADKLADLSPEAIEKKQQKLIEWVATLEDINTDALSEQNQINHSILMHRFKGELAKYQYNAHYMPLTSEGGFHSSLAFLPRGANFKTKQDIENYLARLAAFKVYFEQNIEWMKKGLEQGFTQPAAVLKGYEQSISALITTNPEDSVFYAPFKRQIDFLSDAELNAFQQKAKATIEQTVTPSYQAYYDFMVETYIPNARKKIGIKSVPNGKAYYQSQVEHYTTTTMKPEQIHKLGLQEVARIRAEMAGIIESVGFEGSFSEFLTFLRTDPQFYASTGEALLKEASFIAKNMDAQLPKLFKTLPRTPYGIQPVPAHIAPKYTTGRYVSPSNETDPGYYWVNTYALERRPLYELEALTLHEAVPGHHLQISLAKELKDLPEYRTGYYISAFGEGWGLYAEWLGLEVGFYSDPYSNFGRLTYEMWRATRLVVDTGMHMMGWRREKAINFMMENSALSEHNITTEVDRYISWPAQALSYKIGEIKIKELRQLAEQTLGAKFDVREFHHQILKNGAVPLAQLERQIKDYIQDTNKQ